MTQPDYEPRLKQLAAQNPFLHGLPIRVPEMRPFENGPVVFGDRGGGFRPPTPSATSGASGRRARARSSV